jgi:hypothetical protein
MKFEYRQTQHERFAGTGDDHKDGALLTPPTGQGEWILNGWQQDAGDPTKILAVWQRPRG